MGEQPNPLGPAPAPRMRRADIEVPKPSRRYGLLGKISLLSPGTFYPLSDTASIVGAGSLVLTFVLLGTCRLTVKPLCALTQHLIANQAEGTAPPLHFGGNRPS